MQQISKKKFFLSLAGILVMFLLVLFDQATKYLAVRHLKNQPPISVIPDVFELYYLENHGAAFGILQGQKYLFVVLTVITLTALIYLYIRIPKEKHYFYMHLLY